MPANTPPPPQSAEKLGSWKFLSANRKPVCADMSRRCGMMRRMGFCENDMAFREIECRKTCGVCVPQNTGE